MFSLISDIQSAPFCMSTIDWVLDEVNLRIVKQISELLDFHFRISVLISPVIVSWLFFVKRLPWGLRTRINRLASVERSKAGRDQVQWMPGWSLSSRAGTGVVGLTFRNSFLDSHGIRWRELLVLLHLHFTVTHVLFLFWPEGSDESLLVVLKWICYFSYNLQWERCIFKSSCVLYCL